jgi:hypothetical protein
MFCGIGVGNRAQFSYNYAMNLLCPNCQKMITIADQFAGQLMQCPLCSGTFTAPVLPASGAPPAVPLASSVTSNPASVMKESSATSVADPSGASPVANAPGSDRAGSGGAIPLADAPSSEYPHRYIIWISPRVVPWIAPVALVLVFFMLFFPWRSVPADATSEIGSESGWGKLFSGPLLIFYFLLYLVALALSIGSLLLALKVVPAQPQIAHLIPWKSCIAAGVVALAFLFLYIGFWAESLSTTWFRWTVWLHVIALVGLGLEYCLERRRLSQPLPRIDILW